MNLADVSVYRDHVAFAQPLPVPDFMEINTGK
jgi:hypothetical protein